MDETLTDVPAIERMLRAAAADGRTLSYSHALMLLGLDFTRPRMRALCKTLDAVDRRALAAGEPPLAVLVVRESDGLPGQGWWVSRDTGDVPWSGPDARRYVTALQQVAFDYWRTS